MNGHPVFEQIVDSDKVIAIIISHEFDKPGIHFYTPDDFSQQLAYMNHPRGKKIAPHTHNKVNRHIVTTQEVLFLKKGRLRVDFYNADQVYLESRVLNAGDVILLASGGHGFEALEDIEMFEVKQGPYAEGEDKSRFQEVNPALIKLPEVSIIQKKDWNEHELYTGQYTAVERQ